MMHISTSQSGVMLVHLGRLEDEIIDHSHFEEKGQIRKEQFGL